MLKCAFCSKLCVYVNTGNLALRQRRKHIYGRTLKASRNKWVFKAVRKFDRLDIEQTETDSLFHTTGAWLAKALSPCVFTRADGGTRLRCTYRAEEDRSDRPEETS